jgi:hypothetical protein
LQRRPRTSYAFFAICINEPTSLMPVMHID